ncbi:MAG: lysylphosphatidylglycerol synthase transmembrane domain-containing protein [Candidatus Micrarchaeota archaeon]
MQEMQRNKLILAINAIISVVIIYFILQFIGVDKFLNEISKVDLVLLGISILFLLFMYVLMSLRIKILLEEQGVKATWIEVIRSHFVGMLAADFTPARSGYFATAGMLHYKYNVPSEKAFVSVMGPTVFDFALKVLAGSTAIVYLLWQFLKPEDKPILVFASFAMITMIIIMVLILFSKKFLGLFSFAKTIPLANKVYDLFERMQQNSHAVIKRTPELLGILSLTWSAKAISWYFAAKSVGITIDAGMPEVLFYFLFQPLITMIEFAPLPSFAGTGFSEGFAAVVLGLFGIPVAKGITFALLTRFKTIAVNLIAVPDAINMLLKGGSKK